MPLHATVAFVVAAPVANPVVLLAIDASRVAPVEEPPNPYLRPLG